MKEEHQLRSILPSPLDSGGETSASALPDNPSLSTQSSTIPVRFNYESVDSTPRSRKQSPKENADALVLKLRATLVETERHDVAVTGPVAHGVRKGDLHAHTPMIGTLLQPLVRPRTPTRCSRLLGQRQKRRLYLS
jgi:hypothetical protein